MQISSSNPGATPGKWPYRLGVALALMLIGVLCPAILFDGILREWESDFLRSAEERDLNRAQTLLARFNRNLDPSGVISGILESFRAQAERFLHGRPLNPALARRLDATLRKKLPAVSRVLWFDTRGEMIDLPGVQPTGRRRMWQILFRFFLTPGQLSSSESLLLNGFLKTLFGSLATPEYVQRVMTRVLPSFIDGLPQFLFCRRLQGPAPGSPPLGGWMAQLPIDALPQDWEIRRSIRSLTRGDEMVGGFWQSRQNGWGGNLLSPGLMHGLMTRTAGDRLLFLDDQFLFLSRFWEKDPDLLLTAGIQRRPRGMIAGRTAFFWGRGVLWTASLVLLLLLFGLGCGWWNIRLSLTAKIRLATVLLAGMPVAATLFWGLEQMVQSERWREGNIKRHLWMSLSGLERSIADDQIRVDLDVKRLRTDPEARRARTPQQVQSLLSSVPPSAIAGWMFLSKNGTFLKRSRLPADIERGAWEIFVGTIRPILEPLGFDLRPLKNTGRALANLGAIGAKGQAIFQDYHLVPLEFGLSQFLAFFSLLGKPQNPDAAFLVALFHRSRMLEAFFQKALAASRKTGETLFIHHHGRFSFARRPRDPFLAHMLEVVHRSGREVFLRFSRGGRTYAALGRPLTNLDTAALAVWNTSEDLVEMEGVAGVLLILLALATGAAMVCGNLLRWHLQEPLTAIQITLKRIDQGDYRTDPVRQSPDELGTITTSLAGLQEGLRQKTRLLPLLNRNLLKSAVQDREIKPSFQEVTVLFAGLRDFSRLEATLIPEEAFGVMHQFLRLCERAVKNHGGEIDKFIGDTALAVFSDDQPKVAGARAILAAQQLRRETRSWMQVRSRLGKPILPFGIGLSSGRVVIGSVGSSHRRLDFTVIGDPVNLAARLEKLAGRDGRPEVLLVDNLVPWLPQGSRTIPTDIRSVRGRAGPVTILGLEREDPMHD